MPSKSYDWSFEIAGPIACFSRCDTGSAVISYPVPTRSAIKGMMDCICMSRQAYFKPMKIEVCAPIIYHKYIQNYNGPLRKSDGSFQIMITALINVDYKIYGTVEGYGSSKEVKKAIVQLGNVFMRRLIRGHFFRTPTLGLSEFTASYMGPLRPDTHVDSSVNIVLPSFLDTMYDGERNGRLRPQFIQNARIREGVLYFAE